MKRLTLILTSLFLWMGMALAQIHVTGTVTSAEDGQPVIGASVKVVGTNTGAATNLDGQFSMTVPNNAKLEISYIGMKSQIVKAAANLKVVLQADDHVLDEVIVTGYGNFKKSSFTGAASTMNTDKLADVPVVSIEDKLAGGVAGVQITSGSGSPGSVPSIRVRGMGSINAGNNPLYVIDGTPVQSGNTSEFAYSDAGTNILATINPNDIQSITVIKDAAAASLYGSRAANGVIVITTKSGSKGKTSVNFHSDWGFSNMAVNYRPQLNGDDRRALLLKGLENYYRYEEGKSAAEAATAAAGDIDAFAAKPKTGWTNWKDLLFKNGSHSNYEVSVSGGNDKTQFFTSMAYNKQEGIIANQGLERFSGNLNLTHNFGKFTLNVTSMMSKMIQRLANEGTGFSSAVANYAFFQNPSSTAYDENGSYTQGPGFVRVNPIYENLHSSDRNIVRRMLNSAKLTYHIAKGLDLSEKVTYDYIGGRETVIWDRYSNDGKSSSGVVQRILNISEQVNTQTQLSYVRSFGLHNLDALLGFETEDSHYEYNYMHGSQYPGELYELGNAGETSSDSNIYGTRLTSFLGRVNYNYDNKYYAGLSFRRDGTSRLARSNRWGDFWSASASWRFSAEKFMESTKDILTDGRLRVSYGTNGTQPSGYYSYMNLFKYGERYDGQSGMGIVNIGNPNLRWEKNRTLNIGLDLTFLQRFTASFDWYTRKTTDLIYDLVMSAVPGYFNTSSGVATMATNIGSLRNTGWELTLTSDNFNTKDFSWSTSLNFSHNHNELIKLDGEADMVQDSDYPRVLFHKVGESYNSYYGYEYAGVDPKTGNELYYLNDGTANARNTTTNANEAKKVILGNAEAAIAGGITNNLRWKFIDLGFTFTYQLGGDAYDYPRWQHSNGGSELYKGATPSYYDLSKMWQGEGDTAAKLPKFQYGSTFVYSSRWMMPLDYLRLKNLTIGFSVPQQYIRNLGINKARVYFSGANLLTWKSANLYIDPELPVTGLANFQTPQLRTYTFGIEIGF